ncbi:MAG: ParB N-terminal domain-containing protein [Gemmatimonadales bacterium]|nr:ParB N-terminal domain-containing protein [Gemmatimonadales bacterium]
MSNHDSRIMELPCELIFHGDRHRKDLGDLQALAESIETEGLLQPIGVTPEYELVFGERRLAAVRDVLKREMIEVRIVDLPNIVMGEFVENVIRKDFTPSERVEIGLAVEAELGNRAGFRTDLEPVGNCPQVERGNKTSEIAAERAGFDSRRTYERAKKVVEKAVDKIVAQMDSGELSIAAASLIAEQPVERQHEIAQMPEAEKKAEVRKLRRQDLPTPADARKQAVESGMAILDRNLTYQLPTPESHRPIVERNYAAMAVADAAKAICGCQHSALEIAAGLRSLDTPDMDFVGQCRKAAAFLEEINQEIERNENK